MPFHKSRQRFPGPAPVTHETAVPNPKHRLMEQVREVLRLTHYSIRTEQPFYDWLRRYVRFHGMRSREEMLPAEPIYTHVLRQGGSGIRSPLDFL